MTTLTSTSSPVATAGSPRPFLAVLGVLALAAIALPFVFLREEPAYFHLVFHVLGLTVCGLSIWVHTRLRRLTTSRVIRVLSWICTVFAATWSLGHLGELVSVLGHGGLHATGAVFEEPLHELAATIAVPSWMAFVLSSLVLFATVGVRAVLHRVRSRPVTRG